MGTYTHHFKADSSNILEVWFNDITNVLTIEFKGNRKYQYKGVTREVYDALKNSASIGKFVNENIIGLFPTERL